jgi:hypothetical protein
VRQFLGNKDHLRVWTHQAAPVWALPAAVLIFVLALLIKEVPLRGRAPAGDTASPQPELVS